MRDGVKKDREREGWTGRQRDRETDRDTNRHIGRQTEP